MEEARGQDPERRVRALVRGIAQSLPAALTATPPDPPLDVGLARAQHRDYVAALTVAGAEVAPDESCPDCCFIEDTAVVVDGLAVITRPGAPSRRDEIGPVAAALALLLPVERMEAPATLDGGDCLLLGRTLYMGASTRSNHAGRTWMRALLAPRGVTVVDVPMPAGVLHLKSVCAPLGDHLVLVAAGTLPLDTFADADAEIVVVPAHEAHAANAVAVADTALIGAGCPSTRARVEAAGWKTIAVDTSELRRADGALTCLSILLPW
jgi:dimethylargininase